MSLIDELLGPVTSHVFDDGEDGQWQVSVRPRQTGRTINRTTVVSFRRPGRRNGFGMQVHILQEIARHGMYPDVILESSGIHVARKTAKSILDWLDTLNSNEGASTCR